MIIVKLKGGMGNQMFQYALGRFMSIKYNVPLGVDTQYLYDRTPRLFKFTFRNFDLDVFNISAKLVTQKEVPFIWRRIKLGWFGPILEVARDKIFFLRGNEKSIHFDKKILELGPDVYLNGHWHSSKYFSSIEKILKSDFTLKLPLDSKIEILRREVKSCKSLCIHVRKGDYVGHKMWDTSAGQEYYNKGIKYILSKDFIEKIYVFSDDISWCRKNLTFSIPTMFVGQEYSGIKGEGHHALMVACNHFVIPNSSFSWWAAWLSERDFKIVVAPQKWFANSDIETNDFTPDTWIRI